jgi:hypothetical protein
MLYVLIGLVVVLALVSGAEYAMLRVARAERRAEVMELKEANRQIADKCAYLHDKNKELTAQMERMAAIKEGIN